MGAVISGKMCGLLIIISFAASCIVLSELADAKLICRTNLTDCNPGETKILGMYNRDYNTHVFLPSYTFPLGYTEPIYYVCCRDDNGAFLTYQRIPGDAVMLKLTGDHNAHAEMPGYINPSPGPGIIQFNKDATMGSTNANVFCSNTTCDAAEGWGCVVTLTDVTARGAGRHVGNCTNPPPNAVRICCMTKKTGLDINFERPTPESGEWGSSSAIINVSVFNVSYPIDIVWLEWNVTNLNTGASSVTNKSFGNFKYFNGTHYFYSLEMKGPTGLVSGYNYTFRAYVNNTQSDVRMTAPRSIWLRPGLSISFIQPTLPNNIVMGGDRAFINVSVFNETSPIDKVWLFWNRTTNSTMDYSHTNGTHYFYYKEMTGLIFSEYYYTAYANDTAGRLNSTEERKLTIGGLQVNLSINYGAEYTRSKDVTLNASYTNYSPGSQMRCSFGNETKPLSRGTCDGSGPSMIMVSYPKPWEMNDTEGKRIVHFMAEVLDTLGNLIMSATTNDTIILDKTAPNSSVDKLPALIYNTTRINLSWSATDPNLPDGMLGSGVNSSYIEFKYLNGSSGMWGNGGKWRNITERMTFITNNNGWIPTSTMKIKNMDLKDLVANGLRDRDIYNFTFFFRSIARDNVDNVESKTTNDTNVTVVIPILVHTWVSTPWGDMTNIFGGKTASDFPAGINAKIIVPGNNRYDIKISYTIHDLNIPKESWTWKDPLNCKGVAPDYVCKVDIIPQDGDKRIDYYVYAEQAGKPIINETSPPTIPNYYWHFYMLDHPIAEFMAEEVNLIIGTRIRVPVKVRNILPIEDEFTLTLGGSFQGQGQAVFSDNGGTDWTGVLNPQEERMISVELMPAAETGSYVLQMDAYNSDQSLKDFDSLTVNIMFPAEFPELGPASLLALILLAGIIYYRVGCDKK
jgi:hypothetical protein